jgi:hypothetical protein
LARSTITSVGWAGFLGDAAAVAEHFATAERRRRREGLTWWAERIDGQRPVRARA